ncbi:MAG: TolC family protein, partial [Pseudomonadota bacterium]
MQFPKNIDEAIEIALVNNSQIKEAKSDIIVAKKRIKQAKGDLWPDLDISASAARSYQTSTSKDRSNALSLQGRLTIPIYQQGIQTSQITQARHQLVQAQHYLEQIKRLVVSSVESSWHQLASHKAEVKARINSVKASKQALEGAYEENLVGERTLLDVLNSRQDLRDANIAL